jgi:hypothetical protein
MCLLMFSIVGISKLGAQNSFLTYIDKNNNTYKITESEVEYIPIKASESSSGMYSGGEPWKKKIDNEVFFVIENYSYI